MKERRLFLFLTFLPIGLAIFFWDLDTRLVNSSEKNQTLSSGIVDEKKLPTTILENTRLTQYDISGLQSQQVTSERLLSNDFQKVVDIDLPVITLETDDGLWVAKSQTGEFNQVENRLSLFGSVTLTQTPRAQTSPIQNEKPENRIQNPVQMRTEQLDYYPEIRLAETATPVTITSLGHYIESKGIRVDLTNSVYTLPERVRSTHEPL